MLLDAFLSKKLLSDSYTTIQIILICGDFYDLIFQNYITNEYTDVTLYIVYNVCVYTCV